MGMSIKQLRAFLAVAHTLNFAHASERLNMSQPALSLAIKGLEDSLGGALLLRTTRKVTLTQEGETLLNMGRQLLADWENTEEAMRQRFTLQRGKISIAAMPSFAANVLPSVLKTFRDSYSGINVTVHDVINEHVIEMVSEGRVEMGIAFEPDYSGHLHFTPARRGSFYRDCSADMQTGGPGSYCVARITDAGFHHPATSFSRAPDAGRTAGAKWAYAGSGAGEPSTGDGWSPGGERTGRQRRARIVPHANDRAGRNLYRSGYAGDPASDRRFAFGAS
ncbi:LysR family transcriptional regulator [Citrobacter freundii]|nr:LysR family transcriptional regulator [Citrobacter freundii]